MQGERQPGSGFKLFSLIAALEGGYNVYDSILATSPCAVTFPGVPLQAGYNLSRLMNNDPGDPNGVVTLVEATAVSINCAFLRLAHQVSLQKVIDVAKSMGVSDSTLNPNNPSLVIGTEAVRPIEMSAAYATVADGGIYHTPTFVNRVVDRIGAVIYDGEMPGRRVFSQEVSDEAIVALRATVQYGTGTAAALPNADVAGKTGTTDNSVDAWFNGITPTLVASIWMGDPNGEQPMYVDGAEVYGADYPTQIWHDVMAYALRNVPYSSFPDPDPYEMPPVEYITSPSLEQDDLLSHGGVGAPSCVWDGQLVPCPTTTLPPTTVPPTPTTSKTGGSTTTAHSTTTGAPTTTVPPTVPGSAGGGPVTTFAVPKSPTTAATLPTTAAPATAQTQGVQTQSTPPTATPPGLLDKGGGGGQPGFGGGGQQGFGGGGQGGHHGQNHGYGP